MAAFRPIHEPVSYGKNLPPWNQDTRKGNKKKFNYKERTNKIPLRDKLKQEEAEAQYEKSQREAQLRANKLLAERRRREEELKANKKKPNGILKNGYGTDKSGFVTLTQDQLSTILNTLSKVQGSENEVNLNVDNKDQLKLTIEKPDSRESELSAASAADQLESILSLSKKVKMVDESKHAVNNTSKDQTAASNGKQETSKKQRHNKQVVMNFNLSGESAAEGMEAVAKEKKADKKRSNKKKVKIADENCDEDKVFIRSAAKVVVVEDETTKDSNDNKHKPERLQTEKSPTKSETTALPELSPRQKQLMIPRAHMTKGEKLRLQLELEAASIERLKKENAERAIKLGLPADPAGSEQHKENSTNSMKNTSKGSSSKKVFVEPDFVPGLGDLTDKKTSRPPPDTFSTSVAKEIPVVALPPQSLTRAELKRLQWDKEKAEAPKDYDPWGRPGVGVGPGAIKRVDESEQVKRRQSHRKQELTSQQQTDLHMQLTTSHSPKQTTNSINPLRGPFQEPTTGVPTSILGLENPPREVLKSLAPQMKESLTKAQLLKLKWAEDKAANPEEYNPFGKPGAGAPIRTDSGTVLTSYHSRQKHMMRKSIEDHYASQGTTKDDSSSKAGELASNPNVVPSLDLTDHTPPQEETEANSTTRNHIRGQLVNLDPMTLKEREELRRKELKYQEEIRHQVEEKQRLKREERMQKLKEEAEEEAKFRAERNNAQREVQQAKEMNKLKEWDSGAKEVSRVDLVAEAMQKAKQEAEILKARRRLEKLQAAGHDITHLKAAYEEKFSPRVGPVISDMLSPRGAVGTTSTVPADILSSRTQNSQAQQHVVEPTAVPGLDLTSRANTRHTSRTDDGGYVSNRVVTPHKWQGAQKENLSPVKEFGVQTDTPPPSRSKGSQAEKKMNGGVKRKQVRVISGPKSRKGKETQEIKPWGWKNQVGKKFTAQSKRDPHYEEKQEEKVVRAQARKDQLLKQKSILKKPVRKVQANSKHYPDGKASRAAGDTNRDTVNSYLSPRYKITDSSSPRAGVQESAVTSSRIDKPPVAASKNTDKLRIGSKQSGRGKPAPHSSGYELTADNLQFAADDEFVPFRRSDAVLSPSNAQEVSPMSREQTQAALAREAYYKSMQPAQFGVQMHNIKDSHKTAHGKDPLYNPSLVTKHPTDRQQQVLDSLRQMRQGLMAKQREIASVMSPDLTDNVYS